MKAILFDFFGVICRNPYASWYANHIEIKDRYESYVRDNTSKIDLGIMDEGIFRQGLSEVTGIPVVDINRELESYFVIDFKLVELIKKLREKYKILVISDAPKGMVELILSNNNLESLFDRLIISSNIGLKKPRKEIFDYALQTNGLKLNEVIFIDDDLNNVEAANQLGIKSIFYSNLENLKLKLADYIA